MALQCSEMYLGLSHNCLPFISISTFRFTVSYVQTGPTTLVFQVNNSFSIVRNWGTHSSSGKELGYGLHGPGSIPGVRGWSAVKWTLASLTTAFHSLPFPALAFQFLMPRLLRSLSRSSIHRSVGRPLLLPLSILEFSIILGILTLLILSTCPNHLNLSALINQLYSHEFIE